MNEFRFATDALGQSRTLHVDDRDIQKLETWFSALMFA